MIRLPSVCRKIDLRRPLALALLLLLPICLLPACSRAGSDSTGASYPAITDSPPATDADLYGSWMEISQNGMRIYTFRRDGDLTVYEMESATVVRTSRSGRYTLSDSRLALEFDGDTEVHAVLTGNRALILDGQVLTPVDEPGMSK